MHLRRLLLCFFIVGLPIIAAGQVFGPTNSILSGLSNPAHCRSRGVNVFVNRTPGSVKLKLCTADDVWSDIGGISQATADGLYVRQDGTSSAMTGNLNVGAFGLLFTGGNRSIYSNNVGPRWFDAGTSVQWGFDLSGLSLARTVIAPDASGTMALTSSTVAAANTLATPRAINGVNFDGSAPITVTAAGSTLSDTVPAAKGGTGQTTYTKGDLLAAPGGASLNKLAAGTDAFVLTADAASTNGIKWAAAAGGSPPFTDDATQALVKGTADATKLFGVNLAGLTTGNHPVLTITGTTPAPVWSFPGNLTSPGAGAASEHFGASSAASGNNSVSLGNSALASGLESIAIGGASPATTASGSTTVVIGGRASATNNGGTSLGWNAITSSNGDIALGSGARAAGGIAMGTNSTANGIPSLAIGNASTTGSFTSAVFGRAATATANGQVVFGGNDGSFSYLTDFYGGNGVAVAAPQPVTWHSPGGTGSNVAGANLSLAPGVGTGNTASGDPILKTSPPGASGSTAGTLVSRLIPRAKPISLTSGAAANVIDIPLPTLAMTGGSVAWTIICTDGTDMQTVAGTITYSAVNKGGSYTKDIETVSSATPSDAITPVIGWAKSLSAGTLTTAWAVTTGTNKITLQVTVTTSLTATKFLLYYTINNNSEQDLTPL